MYIFDVAMLLSGSSFDDALIRTIDAHDQYVAKLRISPDGTMAITASWSEPLKLWDIETGQLLGEFGGELLEEISIFDGGFHPTLPLLVVSSPGGEIRIHTLDPDELATIAESRLSRDMTEPECQQHFWDSCPP